MNVPKRRSVRNLTEEATRLSERGSGLNQVR